MVACLFESPAVSRRQVADLLTSDADRYGPVEDPFVELVCRFPAHGLVASLGYNVLLVVVCTWYAFKTRKLPDNFNESRCITFCVYTTLVIWLAFVPTFFTASRAVHEVALLSCALLMNGTVTLLSLYVPRVYALYIDSKPTSATPCQYTVPARLTSRCAPAYSDHRRSQSGASDSLRDATSCAIDSSACVDVFECEEVECSALRGENGLNR